jgi:hypothetical protein
MRKLMNDPVLVAVVVAIAGLAVAAPALAGTVYSWTTEDGTKAFTDQAKRIPAKYKPQAKQSVLGTLTGYPRFTESQVQYESNYRKRLNARLQALRPTTPAVSAAPPCAGGAPTVLGVGIQRSDINQLNFPVGRLGEEPIVTSNHRIQARDTIATQDVTVTKQGDRILSVTIAPKNQRGISENAVGQRSSGPGALLEMED